MCASAIFTLLHNDAEAKNLVGKFKKIRIKCACAYLGKCVSELTLCMTLQFKCTHTQRVLLLASVLTFKLSTCSKRTIIIILFKCLTDGFIAWLRQWRIVVAISCFKFKIIHRRTQCRTLYAWVCCYDIVVAWSVSFKNSTYPINDRFINTSTSFHHMNGWLDWITW